MSGWRMTSRYERLAADVLESPARKLVDRPLLGLAHAGRIGEPGADTVHQLLRGLYGLAVRQTLVEDPGEVLLLRKDRRADQ